MSEIIDVEFKDVTDNNDMGNGGMVINASPEAALISEFASTLRTASNCIKEYKVAQEREKTQRAAIKANMKIAMAEINSQKEVLLRILDDNHSERMANIHLYGDVLMKELDTYIDTVNKARECALAKNDMPTVLALLREFREFVELKDRYYLAFINTIDKSDKPLPTQFLSGNTPAGYLE